MVRWVVLAGVLFAVVLAGLVPVAILGPLVILTVSGLVVGSGTAFAQLWLEGWDRVIGVVAVAVWPAVIGLVVAMLLVLRPELLPGLLDRLKQVGPVQFHPKTLPVRRVSLPSAFKSRGRTPTGPVWRWDAGIVLLGEKDATSVVFDEVFPEDLTVTVEFTFAGDTTDANRDYWFGVWARGTAAHFGDGNMVYLRRSGSLEIFSPSGVLATTKVRSSDGTQVLRVSYTGSTVRAQVGKTVVEASDLELVPRRSGRVYLWAYRTPVLVSSVEVRSHRAENGDAEPNGG